jgi:hypothetical protein
MSFPRKSTMDVVRRAARRSRWVAAVLVGISVHANGQDTLRTIQGQKGKGGAAGNFGSTVARLGDVDGDGVPDFVVGAPTEDPNNKGWMDGGVYVVSGATGATIWKFVGARGGSQLGYDLASGQDFDGDGVWDVVAGAPGKLPGAVKVYSSKTGALLYSLNGESGGALFGQTVFTVDDVNGDAVGDFGAIGRGATDPTVYVYSGKTGKLIRKWKSSSSGATAQAYSAACGTPDLDADGRADLAIGVWDKTNGQEVDVVSGATGSVIYTIFPSSGVSFGDNIGRVGDYDADGYDDLAVSDTLWTSSALSQAGRVYIYSSATGNEIHHWEGDVRDRQLGELPRDGRFDFNGDGVLDVMIGAPMVPSTPPANPGTAYVYSGVDWSLLYTFNGNQASTPEGESLGCALTPIGDVNGDKIDDVLVGAYTYQDKSYAFGQAYVFAGNDLFLQSDKSSYQALDNIEIDTRGGVPYATELLAAIDVNGTPQFTVVDVEQLDQGGNYALIDTVPLGLQGLDVTFQAFATRPPRKGLAASSTILISFQ